MDGFAAVVGAYAWNCLASHGEPRAYRPGESLMLQGEPGERILMLLAGRVKVTMVDEQGHRVLLAVRGPGEVLGEISLLDGKDRSATVSAMDVCDARMLPTVPFLEKLDRLGLRDELTRFAFCRFRESETVRLELATLKAERRVVRGLLRLAVPSGPGVVSVDIGLSQTEFGEAVGLSRASVAGKLGKLRREGLVTTRRERIIITDLPRLRARPEE